MLPTRPAIGALAVALLVVSCTRAAERAPDTGSAAVPDSAAGAALPSGAAPDPKAAWIARHRARGWALLLQVTGGRPELPPSTEWFQRLDAFAASERSVQPGRMFLLLPRELEPPMAPAQAADAAEPPVYESTLFNAAARQHILLHRLQDPATTQVLLDARRREIAEFPSAAIVLKAFWRPVSATQVPVGVWTWKGWPKDPPTIRESQWQGYTGIAPECVVDGIASGSCIPADGNFITSTTDAIQVTCVETNCPPVVPGQKLVLLGLHIASKERPDWFWATFWWRGGRVPRTNGDAWTCDNAQRPDALKTGAWSHYSMDVSPSFELSKPEVTGEAVGECGSPGSIGTINEQLRAAFNPFVEGVVEYGRKSSCIDCHSRASTYQKNLTIKPPVTTADESYPGLRDFQGHIRADYLWSVARRLAETTEPDYHTDGK